MTIDQARSVVWARVVRIHTQRARYAVALGSVKFKTRKGRLAVKFLDAATGKWRGVYMTAVVLVAFYSGHGELAEIMEL